ncbi:MAG: DNA polymerase/3'-5' exonuclease PolX [Parafilimonas sp.]|nr:DNA polymerase/3'-5' exonuclease PolX [Parafilimonas sp.]
MPSNLETSRLFNLYAELLLLHSKDEKLAALLSGASYRMRNYSIEILSLDKKELAELFRPEVIKVLTELSATGTIEALDELIQLTPQGLFDMMRIKGLGGKKLSILWTQAKIDSIDTLLKACKANVISKLPGFGEKSQDNILKSIEAYHSNETRFHYASVADIAINLVSSLRKFFRSQLISLCGEIRRQSTTVERLEIIAAIRSERFKDKALRKFIPIHMSGVAETKAQTLDEVPVTIYHTTKAGFYYELFKRTGNTAHVEKVIENLKAKTNFKTEEAIYTAAGLPFILPEMREDVAEWNFSKSGDNLVTAEGIKGVVHNHTTWSDGVDPLSDFVQACEQRKYEYVVISDHSKNAHYAGGLKEDKVLKQLQEIDKLNKKLAPFRIFKSIECDILVSGELDYGEDILKLFDLVIISVHQLLKMNEEKATRRLIKAIENPYATILGHMTGRQLLIRPGYPVNFKKIIDACAANNVVIEINANPYRLDMDWSHIPYALKKGVMIAVNPDAHSIGEIDNIRWGIAASRKGGLTKDMTWNAMSLQQVERWLHNK